MGDADGRRELLLEGVDLPTVHEARAVDDLPDLREEIVPKLRMERPEVEERNIAGCPRAHERMLVSAESRASLV